MKFLSNLGNIALLVFIWAGCLAMLGIIARVSYRMFMIGWGAA